MGVRECTVGRGQSADLAEVMTEYGYSSVSCACGFLLKSLNDDFLGVDCLVASLYAQLGDSETEGSLGLVFNCCLEGKNCDNNLWPRVGQLSRK